MKIKIKQCQNTILWYNSHLFKTFEVQREDKLAYWVLEPDLPYRCINWVYKDDAEIVNESTNDR